MTVVHALFGPFTVKIMAGRAVLAAESVECADEEHAIELAHARLAKAVPRVSAEVLTRQSMLWSSVTS